MRGGNIETYSAPTERLSPDEKGFAAFETAGRRLHVDYNAAAADYREIGKLQQQEIEGRRWPFDILALENSTHAGLRMAGGGRSAGRAFGSSGFRGGGERYRGFNQIAAGAGALGNYLASNSSGGELIDVANNTTSIGRQTFAGTSDPSRVIDVSGAQGTAPSDDTPEQWNQTDFTNMINNLSSQWENANPAPSTWSGIENWLGSVGSDITNLGSGEPAQGSPGYNAWESGNTSNLGSSGGF